MAGYRGLIPFDYGRFKRSFGWVTVRTLFPNEYHPKLISFRHYPMDEKREKMSLRELFSSTGVVLDRSERREGKRAKASARK